MPKRKDKTNRTPNSPAEVTAHVEQRFADADAEIAGIKAKARKKQRRKRATPATNHNA